MEEPIRVFEEGRVAQKLPNGKRKKGRMKTRAIICEDQPEALARLEDLPKPVATCYGVRVRFQRKFGPGYWEAINISRLDDAPLADRASPAALFAELKALLEDQGLAVYPETFEEVVRHSSSGVPYAAIIVDDHWSLRGREQWRDGFTYTHRRGESLEGLAERCVRDLHRKWTEPGGLLQPLRQLTSKRLPSGTDEGLSGGAPAAKRPRTEGSGADGSRECSTTHSQSTESSGSFKALSQKLEN